MLIAVGFAYVLGGRGGDVISRAAGSGVLDQGALAAKAILSEDPRGIVAASTAATFSAPLVALKSNGSASQYACAVMDGRLSRTRQAGWLEGLGSQHKTTQARVPAASNTGMTRTERHYSVFGIRWHACLNSL